MIRTFSRRAFASNYSIVLPNSIQRCQMATKLQLKNEPGEFVQSRIKVFTENIQTHAAELKQNFTAEPPKDYFKYFEVKLRVFLDVAKSALFITAERIAVVAQSKEMKDALDHTLITLQHYFFLLRRITEEMVVIVNKIAQYIREKRPKDASGGDK